MTALDLPALQQALNLLPDQYRGPGGVAGVVHQGQVVASRAWGFGDMAAGLPLTRHSRLPICSISKQMTCALLLDLFEDPETLQPLLPALLPQLRGPQPSVAQLCHNQSGLRDYWALTVLQGAAPEGQFTKADGLALLAQARSTHFTPGAHFSYSNGNFRLLAELICRATGRDFADLLAEHIFAPAGMTTAVLAADMGHRLDGVIGYEGNDTVGFFPAAHGIHWFGDSGVAASLQDMLAYESHIDATRDTPTGLYNRISAPVHFTDGTPAPYGYGLRRYQHAGQALTGHGGGVRGFCSFRLHNAAERLSVVVIFNHEASAMAAAEGLMRAALGLELPNAATQAATQAAAQPGLAPDPGWDGLWFDEDNQLFLRSRRVAQGVRLQYAVSPSSLSLVAPGRAEAPGLVLTREGKDGLVMQRSFENQSLRAQRLQPVDWADASDIAGRYHAEELGADLQIEARDGAAYIGFHGMLGAGPMERVYPLAADLWSVTCRRAMDAAPPGEWSLRIRRDAAGRSIGLTLGCWLARNIRYSRVTD